MKTVGKSFVLIHRRIICTKKKPHQTIICLCNVKGFLFFKLRGHRSGRLDGNMMRERGGISNRWDLS